MNVGAMLVASEGIVGNWHMPSSVPAFPQTGDSANLDLWPAAIRTHMLDWNLKNGLDFDYGCGGAKPRSPRLTAPGSGSFEIAAPSSDVFVAQMDHLRAYADLRADRLGEITMQVSDILSFFTPIIPLRGERHRYTLQFLDAAMGAIISCHMQFKHALACPRPFDYSLQVQPVIPTPGHGSLPSGHSTEAHALAFMLGCFYRLQNGDHTRMDEMLSLAAGRIAVNRTVAGVHFPIDSYVGRYLGTFLAHHFMSVGGTIASLPQSEKWNGLPDDPSIDFIPEDHLITSMAPAPKDDNSAAAWLFRKACEEWS